MSVCCHQSRSYSCYCFPNCTLHLGLDWDLDSATPAALSNNFSFSHTPCQVGRGGGTGLLISNNWKYSTHAPLCNNNSFESHGITVTAPVKLHVVVIYRPPGQLGTFLEELYGLNSIPHSPRIGSPLISLGDSHSSGQALCCRFPFTSSFIWFQTPYTTTSTHKSGNQLELSCTCSCVGRQHLVKPLHASDHYFITFNLHLATCEPPTPLPVTFRRKLILFSHSTTCPLDPIPSHLLQAISPTLIPALTHIINTSLLTGTFPTAFKQARLTPLLKKTTLNTLLIDSYRPVSLLPFIVKTLEWVVFNQVSSFLSQNNQLDANQSGFKSGHSTETALLYHWSLADSKSWFQIINFHSAGSICCFWHWIIRSSCPPSHHWPSHQLLTGVIHCITGYHHTGTWFLLPLLWWWHTALSFNSTRWSNGTVREKLFDPLLILYVCPLTKKWSVYNFNGRFIWTVRDRITTTTKNPEKCISKKL